MNKITTETINTLLTHQDGNVLSIYMPTHSTPTPPNISENQTRFKNLIRRGFEALGSVGDKRKLEILERQLEQKIDDLPFWHDMCSSLAIFADEDGYRLYHLPIEIAEQVYVGDTYDVIPLLQLKSLNRPYYVFALAQHEPKLLHGDLYGLEPVDISFPESMEVALNIDEMFINSNTIRAGSGSMKTSPHGQGDSQEAGGEERLMYFRILDKRIAESSKIDKTVPILIAATDSEAGDFRAISKLPNLLGRHLGGNRTKENLHELHMAATALIMDETVEPEIRQIAELYQKSVGAERATNDVAAIERAAREGRVGTLILSALNRSRDSIGNRLKETFVEEIKGERKQKILTLIGDVVRTGGSIELFPRQLMPEQVTVAAVYRY